LKIWLIFIVFGILTTPSAAPGSIEGMIYSKLPLWCHLLSYPELFTQTFLFSILLFSWETKPVNAGKVKTPNIYLETLVIGCYSYIGSAVGAVSSIFITGAKVNFEKASSDIRSQLMFVAVFLINEIYILIVKKKQRQNKYLSNPQLFMLTLGINIVTLFCYQLIFYGSSNIFIISFIGIFPALIIWSCLKQNFNKN
jgi:hypothetical protein